MNTLFKHYQDFISYKSTIIKSDSLKVYYTIAKNLRLFLLKNKEFQDLNKINSIRFIRSFNQFLRPQFGRGHIGSHLSKIKNFIIFLVNDEILEYSKIRDYTPILPKEEKKIISLSTTEVTALENFEIDNQKLKNIKNLFLLQCYTGLSYGDLMKLNKTMFQVRDGINYLVGNRSKSGIAYVIPLQKEALVIIEEHSYKLPIISNQKYNKYLKELAAVIGINKHLTTHIGRKTCGQLFLDFGYSIEAVSRILGHSDIRTTQKHYAQSSFELVHKEHLRVAS